MKNKTTKQYVEEILKKDVLARNDDKHLMTVYWKEVDGVDMNNFESSFFERATQPESISRARRLIQHQGKYMPTDSVLRGRRAKEFAMKKSILSDMEVI